MDRLIELGQLTDWYGEFLTERQRSLVRQYAFEDCSLSEIAEREGISRQAVRDAIATAENELKNMEQKLGLIQKEARAKELLDALAQTGLSDRQKSIVDALAKIISEDDDGV
jgi:predicted DNA-binding protein YlxM (UPF0122 family)